MSSCSSSKHSERTPVAVRLRPVTVLQVLVLISLVAIPTVQRSKVEVEAWSLRLEFVLEHFAATGSYRWGVGLVQPLWLGVFVDLDKVLLIN